MHALSIWIFTLAISVAPPPGAALPAAIDVDCSRPEALERALLRAERTSGTEIRLHGVCEGNFVLSAGDVTLRAASPGAGLAAAADDPGIAPVFDVRDARAVLRGTTVRGGVAGVRVRGSSAEVLLVEADVHSQSDVGLIAEAGATLRLLETAVHDGDLGIAAHSDVTVNVQRSRIHDLDTGLVIADGSSLALSDTIVERNRTGGLNVTRRSDASILGGAFRDNAQVHVNANDWSGIALLAGVELGSPGDPTSFAFGATRNSRVSCASTPAIYGHVSALDGGSVRLSNATVEGDLVAIAFADAIVRNGTVTGVVFCADGADVICSGSSGGAVFGCPSTSCGTTATTLLEDVPRAPRLPEVKLPRLR